MAGVATAARYGVCSRVPHRMFFSKIMENYKILNPEKAPSWACLLTSSVLNTMELAAGLGNKHCSLQADREGARGR